MADIQGIYNTNDALCHVTASPPGTLFASSHTQPLRRRSLDQPFKRSTISSRTRAVPAMEPLLRSGSGELRTPPGAFTSSTAPAHATGMSDATGTAPQSIPEDVPLPSLPRPRSAVHLDSLPPIRKSYPASLDPGSIESWQSGRPQPGQWNADKLPCLSLGSLSGVRGAAHSGAGVHGDLSVASGLRPCPIASSGNNCMYLLASVHGNGIATAHNPMP